MQSILVTGGFGFIGSNFVLRYQKNHPDDLVIVLDKFSYAASPQNLADANKAKLAVYRGDIGNEELVANILSAHQPRAIINFAAESHVDRSIAGPAPFIKSNIDGLATLLEVSRQYAVYRTRLKLAFRFVQVSTDEVYGSVEGPSIEGLTPYAPRSPYAASKAAGDHLCKAYFSTYGFPILLTNCGNNYGPRQHPEKFIPTAIIALMQGRKIPVYGTGKNYREWIYVDDHCDALELVLDKGIVGKQYHISTVHNLSNIILASTIINSFFAGGSKLPLVAEHVEFVKDRPGHDLRYALNTDKIQKELGWTPKVNFNEGIDRTIQWYQNQIAADQRLA